MMILSLLFPSACGKKTDPNYPDQIELKKGSGSVDIPPGRNVTVRSTDSNTGYRVRFDQKDGKAFFYALGFHPRTGNKIMLEMLLVYEQSPNSTQEKKQVEILWSLDGKQTLLSVDGRPQALLDFENEQGMCRTGEPRMAGPWSKRRVEWDEKLLDRFTNNLEK